MTSSVHHELSVTQKDDMNHYTMGHNNSWFPQFASEWNSWNRKDWQTQWKTEKTTDNKLVYISDLFQNSEQLSKGITSHEKVASLQCYVLSMFNPIKPHFKLVSCAAPLLNYFLCEKEKHVNTTTFFSKR